jgi:hypothetical protein
MKFYWYQFDYLVHMISGRGRKTGGPPTSKALAEAFPNLRYVWLTRRDKARQAISYFQAIRAGKERNLADEAFDTSQHSEALNFDFAAIEHLERMLIEHESHWQRYFEQSDIEPLVLVYEELKDDIENSVRATLDYLEISFPGDHKLMTTLTNQTDSLSEAWANRYVSLKEARTTNPSWFLHSVSPSRQEPFLNGVEFRVAAPQRSGHHAVINWLAGQCDGTILYLNDVKPGTNPFFTCTIVSRLDLPGTPQYEKTLLRVFERRDFLIVSYEDRGLEEIFCEEYRTNHDVWVGSSGLQHQVIVLRDAFNTFASRMRASWMRHKLTDDDGRGNAVGLWKSYARTVADRAQLSASDCIFINYNLWFTSEQYRREIAAELGLHFTDRGRKTVSGRYGGSSFDGVKFNGAADQMRVLERWKDAVDDPLYRDLFRDRELIELSNEVFGRIPGTEVLVPTMVSVDSSTR